MTRRARPKTLPLTCAIGLAVLPLLALAPASSAAAPTAYTATAQATAITIAITLPAALGDAIPATSPVLAGGRLRQTVVTTSGAATAPAGTAAPAAGATSSIAGGSLTGPGAPLAAIGQTAFATYADPGTKTVDGALVDPATTGGAAGAGVGRASATVVRAGPATSGSAQLAALQVGSLATVVPAPVLTIIDQVTNQVTNQVTGAQDQFSTIVGGILDTVDTTTGGATSPVTNDVRTVQQTLDALVPALAGLPQQLQTGALVSATAPAVQHEISRAGDSVTATARSQVAAVDVLGGYVKIRGLVAGASASATGSVGGSRASAPPILATIEIGEGSGAVLLGLTDQGLSGSIGGATLPPTATTAISQLLAAVNDALALAGVHILPSTNLTTAADDGTSASASASGLLVIIDPLAPSNVDPETALVALRLGAADASVAVTPVVTSSPSPSLSPQAQPQQDTPQGSLALTGGALTTGALLGALLLVGAAVLRRSVGRAS